MDWLQYDPALEPCPDYNDELFCTIRAALIADPNLGEITNEEQATQHLKDTWATNNAARQTRWLQQTEEDREREEQRRQQEEENHRLLEEEERKKEEERKSQKEKSHTLLISKMTSQLFETFQELFHYFLGFFHPK
ncbi:hypothetical protein VKT23_009328 [Stygiomarasmius scandens]|uniref:Uncharacterized protein n=1 Tax=Marasmiellus scandens TaxID=2682957 RepID=A0ABR1JJ94_9AGAR